MYGPTETTIWSTFWKVQKSDGVRIGKPLPNQQVFVLGQDLQRKPIGIYGELAIGGAGVSNGYLKNAPATDAKFIQHPAYGRLFRTGDMARMLADGNLEFHGRNDQQVKLHGHRFELGDVEAAIVAHPAVSQAVALIEGSGMNSRLIAHVCNRESGSVDLPGLKVSLAQRLPKYMIPSEIRVHARMLLNGSGKVDRQAMATASDHNKSSRRPAEVGTHQELPIGKLLSNETAWDRQRMNQLRETIREELKLESIAAQARWSDLEISSLDVVGLVVRLERDLNIRLPVADFFRDCLIDQTLATAIGESQIEFQFAGQEQSGLEIEEGLI
jgi:acyl carrier protein